MTSHLRANGWLLLFTLVLCAVLYPGILWVVGQGVFPHQAQGSLVDRNGRPTTVETDAVGSRLLAQPFSGDEFFQPRPSAASYNGAASGASNWGASNNLLRERVARQLGPVVKYRGGPNKGKRVGPDVESWFRKDHFRGNPGIVAQWAQAHPAVAQNWVKADKANTDIVGTWQKSHPSEVARWIKENPDTPEPKPEDLAVPFFQSYSRTNPGTFPSADKKQEGTDIQGIFFDMWRQEHPQEDLEPVPADMVMASGSGLDPHITLENAHSQLDRVVEGWVKKKNLDPAKVREAVESVLREKTEAPLGGLVGTELINVLEVNLALRERFGS